MGAGPELHARGPASSASLSPPKHPPPHQPAQAVLLQAPRSRQNSKASPCVSYLLLALCDSVSYLLQAPRSRQTQRPHVCHFSVKRLSSPSSASLSTQVIAHSRASAAPPAGSPARTGKRTRDPAAGNALPTCTYAQRNALPGELSGVRRDRARRANEWQATSGTMLSCVSWHRPLRQQVASHERCPRDGAGVETSMPDRVGRREAVEGWRRGRLSGRQ